MRIKRDFCHIDVINWDTDTESATKGHEFSNFYLNGTRFCKQKKKPHCDRWNNFYLESFIIEESDKLYGDPNFLLISNSLQKMKHQLLITKSVWFMTLWCEMFSRNFQRIHNWKHICRGRIIEKSNNVLSCRRFSMGEPSLNVVKKKG